MSSSKSALPRLPPELPYTHIAGRAPRRILVERGAVPNIIGMREVLSVLLANPSGPWVDDHVVDSFLTAQGLAPGDIVDLASAGGDVRLRLQVSPRGLRILWSAFGETA